MMDIIRRDKSDDAASSKLLASLDQFATLITRLDLQGVAVFSLGYHACHASHVIRKSGINNRPTNQSRVLLAGLKEEYECN